MRGCAVRATPISFHLSAGVSVFVHAVPDYINAQEYGAGNWKAVEANRIAVADLGMDTCDLWRSRAVQARDVAVRSDFDTATVSD